ncbi:outer envelope pore protein 16-1, chloroplastic isoform X9 [Elaeis guineensis]|uniref:outer envelope pore protein 16-1, chloroplastic isoform X9 n=1 Tax=Elaeis guineensis var. tenera TaxID=51953 RepID=UPI003C6DB5F3
MGNAFLNRTVDGFLKIGAVGASKVAAEETYDCLKKVKEDLQRRCILGYTFCRNYSWGVCRNGVWSGKDAWYQRLDSHITHLLVKWRGTQLLFSHLLLPLSLGT